MPRGAHATDWQRAVIALSATVIATVMVLALYWARTILMPLALAVFLAFVLGPVVAWLQRRGLGRTPAVILTVGLAILVSGGTAALVSQQVIGLADQLSEPERAADIKAKVAAARNRLTGGEQSRLGKLVDDLTEIVMPRKKTDPPPVSVAAAGGAAATATSAEGSPLAGRTGPVPVTVESGETTWADRAGAVLTPVTEALGQAAFAFILTVYMLLRKEDLRNRMIRLTGHGKVTTTTKAVDDASTRISRYLLAQLLLNAAFGVVITVGLFLIGVQYAVLWGVIAFVMRYVPYVGTWIGVIPPTLYAFALYDGPTKAVATFALFIGLEMLCNNIFEPMLYGRSMGLSEVAQLVAAGVWAFLWGPIGLILSGPLTVCLLVLGKYVARFRFLEVLLGDEPALAPKVAFYQRLTARDQDEAAAVALAERDAGGSSPEAVFDKVVIPALCLTRRDQADGDLSADDVRFITRAAREVAEEVVGDRPLVATDPAAEGDRVRLLLCPARDEIDHVSLDLLAHLLEPERWEIEVTADEILASELLARVEEVEPSAVVIGAVPPGGLAHTRYLVARLRGRFPDVKIIVGRWGRAEEIADADAERSTGADWVDDTLAETRKRLTENHSVFAAAGGGKSRAVGTAGASAR